jgi:hypothetical protein
MDKVGRRTVRTKLGVMGEDGKVRNNRRVVGEYRPAGLYPEVAAYLYRQVANVWRMDNEFVAHLASWAFAEDYRDLKVVLAAFSLVQSRRGDPVREGGEIIFYDDDYRDIGEAMCLLRHRDRKDLSPKLLLRVGDVLRCPDVAEINRELGFTRSARNPAMGRWPKAVTKWLRYREQNTPLLEGLVRAGYRKTVMRLAQQVGYKPESAKFFETLRWKQKQSGDGRRTIAIGEDVVEAETWEGMTEAEICERIVETRPNFKRVSGLLPSNVGLTRAIMAASIEAGSLSDSDLIIMTPSLEEFGLLDIPDLRTRWEAAVMAADNQRARNIALRTKRKENIEVLDAGADAAAKAALEEVMKGIRVYFIVDKSGSMDGAIERAKSHLSKILAGFPLDKLHVSIFNTTGREVNIRHASAAGVTQAFRGHRAAGGTNYASGVLALQGHRPAADEDAVMVFVGDQCNSGHPNFAPSVERSGINPVAFGMINVAGFPL